MSNIVEFLRRHKKWILLCIAVATIGVPLLINILYKIPAPFNMLSAEWFAADALSYYGAVLSFLGTSILSILALWQNQKIDDANVKHTALLEQMERQKISPFFIVKYISGKCYGSDLKIKLINISENLAQQVTVSDFEIVDQNNEITSSYESIHKIEYICPHEEYDMEINNAPLKNRFNSLRFKIECQDLFGCSNHFKVIGTFVNNTDEMKFLVIKETVEKERIK